MHGSTPFALLLGFLGGPFALLACAVPQAADEAPVGKSKDALSTSLMYEGTCDFLRSCSSYSKELSPPQVTWGCEGVAECSDDELWVAGPSHAYCGRTMTICAGKTCTPVLVRDVSSAGGWEASSAVMDALGLPYGLLGKCSGYGGGHVSITSGGTAPPMGQTAPPPSPEPPPDPNPPDPPPPDADAGAAHPDGPSCQDLYDGLYCGSDYVNGDPDTLYECSYGEISVVQVCAYGCSTSASYDDACE